MTFEELITNAVSRSPDDGEDAPAPSMDILSRALMNDVMNDARHFRMHRDPIMSMLGDIEGGMSPFTVDAGQDVSPTDMTLVENQLGYSNSLDQALGLTQSEGPSTADMVRDLLRSL